MICEKCNAEIPNGVRFCPKCGNRISNENTTRVLESKYSAGVEVDLTQQKRHKFIGMAAVVLAAVIIIILISAIFPFGRSEKELVDQYVKASFTADAKTLWKLLPEEMRTVALEQMEEEYIYGEEEAIAYIQGVLETSLKSLYDYLGEGWKYSYEIVSEEELSATELGELIRAFREDGVTTFQASEGKELEIELTLESSDGELLRSSSLYFTIVKIGNSWYVTDWNL